MNRCLSLLYNEVAKAIVKYHPYDEKLVGEVATLFIDFDEKAEVKEK